MYYNWNKQVLRREQIKERTLVLGTDVGKEFNSIAFMDQQGQILKKISKVYNSAAGYEWLLQQVRGVQDRGGFRDVMMGLEPTGHYWRKLCTWTQ